jgi:hypothetical protein
MLIYHPAFDLHHGVFRMTRLLLKLPTESLEVERIRILDFFLLFPALLVDIQYPRELMRYRSVFKKSANKYEKVPDPHRLFIRLEPYQRAALSCLAAYDLIDPARLNDGKVLRTGREVPATMAALAAKADTRFPEVVELLTGPFRGIDLYGKGGLKARTDLFEHRYDLT